MQDDSGLRNTKERLERLHRKLEALLGQSVETVETLNAVEPSATSINRLEQLRAEWEEAVRGYLDQNASLLEYVREQARKNEEVKRRTAMSERPSKPARDQARIQELSEELTRDLRLERIDNAMKELLDFLADTEFFAANASTGRRRRLRTLQNAIARALDK